MVGKKTVTIKIAGIDPGVTTGFCVLEVSDRFARGGVLLADEVPTWARNGHDPDRHACWGILDQCLKLGVTFLAVEDFFLRGEVGTTDRSGISPALVAECLKGELWRRGVIGEAGGLLLDVIARRQYGYMLDGWRWQQAAQAKTVVTNARLRSAGLWMRGYSGKPHLCDALRHAELLRRTMANLGGSPIV